MLSSDVNPSANPTSSFNDSKYTKKSKHTELSLKDVTE